MRDPQKATMYAQVLIDRPARSLDRAFTYAIPEALRGRVRVGSYVLVPFGKQSLPGFVIGFTDAPGDYQVKRLYGLLVDEPIFDERLMSLAEWLADRYVSSLAEALRVLLPPGGSRKVIKVATLTAAGQSDAALAIVRRAPKQLQVLTALQALGLEAEAEALLKALNGTAVEPVADAAPAAPAAGRQLSIFGAEAPARPPRRASAPPARTKTAAFTTATLESALSALQERGLVEVRRELQRPAVQALERQVVSLVEGDQDWEALLETLQERAPRQAEVIAALLAAVDCTAAVADFSRPAVQGLVHKGHVTVSLEALDRAPEVHDWNDAGMDFLQLNDAQRRVYEAAREGLQAREHREFLVHGVTGSGKTEVYLHCVDLALRQGRTAIVAVPEIALTPQMVGRFRARFGKQLALLHSALGQGERFDEWYRAQRGEARIVVGARSALFAPLQDVGIIVVDEPHENAYKQEQPPRYHGVEAARQRARLEGAVLLLGSATPTVELYWEASQELGRALESPPTIVGQAPRLRLMDLPHRIDHRPMPDIRVLDLRAETLVGAGQTFSQRLLDGIADRLRAGEQIMLFLNRRGFSTFIICRDCGFVLRCPDCEISLTFHHQGHSCTCHHCDYARHVPEVCPQCQGKEIGFHGLGTEKVADQVVRLFPEATVARMDRDTIAHKGAYGRILGDFAAGKANVLVGTQMIAKGHDFPGVTLVGVLNADTGLHRPDFRAAEHTFQVLTQVAGRAGRADKPGEVLVQTYNPDHHAIVTASRHDYQGFYQRELASREKPGYPPFVRLARLVFAAEDDEVCHGEALAVKQVLQDMGVAEKHGPLCFMGPAQAPLRKLRGRYRWSILLKSRAQPLPDLVRELLGRLSLKRDVSLTVDVDPTDMM